jgi:hypothetical protein
MVDEIVLFRDYLFSFRLEFYGFKIVLITWRFSDGEKEQEE